MKLTFHSWRRAGHALAFGVATCIFLAWSSAAVAQEPPWKKANFDLMAANEPLNTFLTRVLTLQGVPTTTSAAVASGRVSGRIRGDGQTLFRELADTYGLTWYWDGTTLHVYSLAELESRILAVDPPDLPRIEQTLRQMKLADGRFPLRFSAGEGQVLVSGPPRFVQLVTDVVMRVAETPSRPRLDIDARIFRLRHARAADTTVVIGGAETMVPGVARLLNDILGHPAVPGAGGSMRVLPATVPGLRGQGLSSIGKPPALPAVPDAGPGTAGKPALIRTGLQAAGDAAAAPAAAATAAAVPAAAAAAVAAVADGPPRDAAVRAEPRLNAVIVRDTPQRMHLYERLIAQLDVETPLVEIEAAIIDVAHDKTEELGVDWRLQLSTHVDIRSTQQEPPQRGGLATLIIGSQRNHLMARVNALAERGDARLISRPRVLTLDNLEAVLQSTREFYVRVAGREQVDLFNVSTGLTMRVTPTFVEEETAGGGKRFRLVVRIEDGNTAGTEVDRIPVVNRNAISTQAVVGDGQSLLIGGYEVEETRDGKSGVPVLSELPGVGWLFGRRSSGSRKVERMFMITPRLVNVAAAPAPAAPAVAPPAAPAKPAVSAMPAPVAVAPVVAAPVVPVAVPPAAPAAAATPAAAAIVARPDERAAVVVRERVAPAKEAASVPPPQMPADVSPPPAQPGREPVREPVREPAREPVATAVALAAVPATLPVSKPGTPAGLRSGSRVDLVEVMNALGLKVPSR